jgi:hypothetical protein
LERLNHVYFFYPAWGESSESSGVVALRMMTLMSGGNDALHEVELMVSEKVDAAFEAAASLMGGASGDE